MKAPLSYRKNIPLYHSKTELEYQKDVYERYDPMVIRQLVLHLADEWWGGYPLQKVLDFAAPHYPQNPTNLLEIGCGLGRWIATLAQQFPQASCWGMDYSYQLLRQAHECWIQGKALSLDGSQKGFARPLAWQGQQLSNLHLGLAKASALPFEDNSQDLVVSSFLLDRLPDPVLGLKEMGRVLHTQGRLVVVTPLNFDQAHNWQAFYPPEKLAALLPALGLEVLEWQEDLLVKEPLDRHGNGLVWKCLGLVGRKVG